jgi:LacI family gluconate utilization system Gnt-I transcriptional repressor
MKALSINFEKDMSKRHEHRSRSRLSDVAARAGVSAVTVSRAIRHPEMVTPKLRKRIEKAIHDLAYVPNRAASMLASSRTQLIGVVVSSLTNGVFADFLRALHDLLLPEGFQVMVLDSRYVPEEEETAIATLLGQHPEAMIVSSVDQTPRAKQLLKRSGIPVVQTMELAKSPIDINIGLSHEEAGYAATRYLIDLGHRKVGIIGAPRDSRLHNRIAGYERAMREAGLDMTGLAGRSTNPSSVVLGGELMRGLVERRPDIEAVFCCNDDLALGALFECHRLGISVPDRISLVGFNDLEYAACAYPSLTSVLTPRYEMGRKTAEIVLEIIRGSGKRPQRKRIDIGYKIMERESSRAREGKPVVWGGRRARQSEKV